MGLCKDRMFSRNKVSPPGHDAEWVEQREHVQELSSSENHDQSKVWGVGLANPTSYMAHITTLIAIAELGIMQLVHVSDTSVVLAQDWL